MPLYNAQKYLAQTLDSLQAQTFTDFELIIGDNASTDATPDIVATYTNQDPRIRYHRHPQNLGAAPNFNWVFHQAKGTYFRWMAYDDPIAPTYLEKTVAVLEGNPEAIMCYPRTILIDEDDTVIEYHDDQFNLRDTQPHRRFHRSFRASAWCHPVFGLIRRDVLAKTVLIGAYASSDKTLLGELALRGQCHEYPEHLAYRRLHPENSTSSHTTDEAMAHWFDSQATRTQWLTPRWRRFLEHGRTIYRTPMPLKDKGNCYGELLRFYFALGRVKGVLKDIRSLLPSREANKQ